MRDMKSHNCLLLLHAGHTFLLSHQEVYDFEKKLVMVKGSNWWNPNLGPVVQIHDFNTGIGYNMSTPNKQNQHGCHLFNITDKTWDATDAGNHHIRMKTTQELFNSQNGNQTATIVYKGVSSIREIEADVWVSNGISCRLERNNKSQEVGCSLLIRPLYKRHSLLLLAINFLYVERMMIPYIFYLSKG